VKTLPRDVVGKLDRLTAPRLVEYWETDPCGPEWMDPAMPRVRKAFSGEGDGVEYKRNGHGVKVEARFEVGEYDVVILSAKDAMGLEAWLKEKKYRIPDGAEPLFRPYIQSGMKFFVAKVNAKKVTFKDGMATLSPLRFHYDSETFSLPVRLGLINAKEKQDLIVHILAKDQRYEAANYPNVTIPTNIDLAPSAKSEFPYFYVSLFDRTLAKHPNAVVTEYAWQATGCDPCPGPALDQQDVLTLGGDVLKDANAWDFVLTRLHARYDKASLGEDLVFKAAKPIVGGREFLKDGKELETGAVESSMNNFQGRYAIRYPWTGPVKCQKPVYGRWGGPPGQAKPPPGAAQDTAFAKRDPQLAETLAESPIAELDIKGQKARAGVPLRAAKAPRR
jgi:hypothetical protein